MIGVFFSTYNTEQAFQMIEVGASKNDKDYVMAFNWVKAKACKDAGKAKDFTGVLYHNYMPENAPAIAERMSGVRIPRSKRLSWSSLLFTNS